EYYEMKVSVYKKPPQFVYNASLMQFAAQPYNPEVDPEPPAPSMSGPYVSALMQQAVQPDGSGDFGEADSMSGPNVALLPHQ
ncbi:hypothetical protein SP019_00225, partial [Salmonella phage FSL SP-019]